jgi:hypothetical protein
MAGGMLAEELSLLAGGFELFAIGELLLPGGLLLAEESSLFAGGLSLDGESSMVGEIMSLAISSLIGNL